MNSQNTKAIGGSNCSAPGASRFQPSQITVQVRTIRKKPIVPPRLVIQQASLSSVLNFSVASVLTFRSGFRRFLNLSRESGLGNITAVMSLTAKPPSHDYRTRSVRVGDGPDSL